MKNNCTDRANEAFEAIENSLNLSVMAAKELLVKAYEESEHFKAECDELRFTVALLHNARKAETLIAEAECRKAEKERDELRLKSAAYEQMAERYWENWKDSREKGKRKSAEIRRLLAQNKAFKLKILKELEKSEVSSSVQGDEDERSITLRIWKPGETPPEGFCFAVDHRSWHCGLRFFDGKTNDPNQFLIGPLPDLIRPLYSGEGDSDE